jgi:hypothetical protein
MSLPSAEMNKDAPPSPPTQVNNMAWAIPNRHAIVMNTSFTKKFRNEAVIECEY